MIFTDLDMNITLKNQTRGVSRVFDFLGNVHIQIRKYHLRGPPRRGRCIGEVINGWKESSASRQVITRVSWD